MDDDVQNQIDLEATLVGLLRNEASNDDLARLNEALLKSDELRSQACRFLCHDALLMDIVGIDQKAASIVSALEDNSSGAPGKVRLRSQSWAYRAFDYVNRHGFAVGTAAAILIIGLVVRNALIQSEVARLHSLAVVDVAEQDLQSPDDSTDLDGDAHDSPRAVVGRVAGLRGAVWAEGELPLLFGDRIEQGQVISLESGVVELLLSTGAKVTVEGPARFEATSATETWLAQGRIAAAAPRVARGYTVLTPTSELVDIGTQFGVIVEDSGDTELHVFDGDVVARSRLQDVGAELIHAKQDEAMRFDSNSPEPKRFAAREADFIRHVAPVRSPDKLPAIPSTRGLSIWYSADTCAGHAQGDRIATWRDLLIGDNDFADDAWQFDDRRCPTLVEDGAGRPALHFDGWSTFLATSPMEPSDRQTIFVVCAPAPISYANEHQGQILLKYGIAPSLELSVLGDFSARGWVWPGRGSSNVGEVRSKPIEQGQIAVIAYEYNVADDRAQLWLNGESQGTTQAPVPVRQPGRKYIGSHTDPHMRTEYFGMIYEIVIFDETFAADEMASFWSYFSDRYLVN